METFLKYNPQSYRLALYIAFKWATGACVYTPIYIPAPFWEGPSE